VRDAPALVGGQPREAVGGECLVSSCPASSTARASLGFSASSAASSSGNPTHPRRAAPVAPAERPEPYLSKQALAAHFKMSVRWVEQKIRAGLRPEPRMETQNEPVGRVSASQDQAVLSLASHSSRSKLAGSFSSRKRSSTLTKRSGCSTWGR
jgi:hypothetical protein